MEETIHFRRGKNHTHTKDTGQYALISEVSF